MSDFILVVDFFFNLCSSVFVFIMSHWLTALFFLILVVSFFVSILQFVKGSQD